MCVPLWNPYENIVLDIKVHGHVMFTEDKDNTSLYLNEMYTTLTRVHVHAHHGDQE